MFLTAIYLKESKQTYFFTIKSTTNFNKEKKPHKTD